MKRLPELRKVQCQDVTRMVDYAARAMAIPSARGGVPA